MCKHWGSIIAEMAKSARRRKMGWSVNTAYVMRLFEAVKAKCPMSGLPLELGQHSKDHKNKTVSLDRIDSNVKSYCPGNVQLVHKRANIAKSNLPDELALELFRHCVENHKNKGGSFLNMSPTQLANELKKHSITS